jgi:hypothetical protein
VGIIEPPRPVMQRGAAPGPDGSLPIEAWYWVAYSAALEEYLRASGISPEFLASAADYAQSEATLALLNEAVQELGQADQYASLQLYPGVTSSAIRAVIPDILPMLPSPSINPPDGAVNPVSETARLHGMHRRTAGRRLNR